MKKVSKKIILMFSLIFCLTCMFGINNYAFAAIIPNDISGYCAYSSFNYCKGILDNEHFDEKLYDTINEKVGKYIKDGFIETTLPGIVGSRRSWITENLYFYDGILNEVEYLFEDDLFFEAKIYDKDVEVLVDYELDFAAMNRYEYSRFIAEGPSISLREVVFYDDNDFDQVMYDARDYCLSYLSGLMIQDNTLYKDLDCHIVMEYNNKLSLEQIKDAIKANDNSKKGHFQIVENEYDEKTSGIGTYNMLILAYDDYNHFCKQKVIIDVRDDIAPIINIKKPIIVDYNTTLKDEDLIKYFDIIEESEYKYSFDLEKYNKEELGTYELTLEVTDIYNNSSRYDFSITVKDTSAPVVTHLNLSLDNLYKRSLEELIQLAKFTAIDNYDGDVISKLKFESYSRYEDNYYAPGLYLINYSIEDSSGNSCNSFFTVWVEDVDYPTIEVGKYCILKEKGSTITKEEVLELLENSGYSVDIESIDGECFSLTSLDGEYSFIYEEDGIVKEGIVLTSEDKKIVEEVETPIETITNETNPTFIICVSIGLASAVSLIILFIFVYKKKH